MFATRSMLLVEVYLPRRYSRECMSKKSCRNEAQSFAFVGPVGSLPCRRYLCPANTKRFRTHRPERKQTKWAVDNSFWQCVRWCMSQCVEEYRYLRISADSTFLIINRGRAEWLNRRVNIKQIPYWTFDKCMSVFKLCFKSQPTTFTRRWVIWNLGKLTHELRFASRLFLPNNSIYQIYYIQPNVANWLCPWDLAVRRHLKDVR